MKFFTSLKIVSLCSTVVLLNACGGGNNGNANSMQQVNDNPSITTISDVTISANEISFATNFIVDDPQTSADLLTVTASSDNPSVIADAGLQIVGANRNKLLNITPVSEQLGNANITVTVSDAEGASDSTSFTVTVVPQMISVANFAIQLFDDDANATPREFDSRVFVNGNEDQDIYPDVSP